jgi:hypothetical protein
MNDITLIDTTIAIDNLVNTMTDVDDGQVVEIHPVEVTVPKNVPTYFPVSTMTNEIAPGGAVSTVYTAQTIAMDSYSEFEPEDTVLTSRGTAVVYDGEQHSERDEPRVRPNKPKKKDKRASAVVPGNKPASPEKLAWLADQVNAVSHRDRRVGSLLRPSEAASAVLSRLPAAAMRRQEPVEPPPADHLNIGERQVWWLRLLDWTAPDYKARPKAKVVVTSDAEGSNTAVQPVESAPEVRMFKYGELGEFTCPAAMMHYLCAMQAIPAGLGEQEMSERVAAAEALRQLHGKMLRDAVKRIDSKPIEGLQSLMADAMTKRIRSNWGLSQAVKDSTLPFTMYYTITPPRSGRTVQRDDKDAYWLVPVIEAIRTALQTGDGKGEPDFSFLDTAAMYPPAAH